MNDASVNAPTPGSSSVEAYEEDWYRSLRALAERRRSELERFDEDQADEADASTPTTHPPDTPGDVRAKWPPEGEITETAGMGGAASDGADVSRGGDAAASSTVEASAPGDSERASPGVTGSAVGQSLDELIRRARERALAEVVGGGSAAATRDAETEQVRSDAAGGSDALDLPTEVPPTTQPWARVLRPLERIGLAPLPDEEAPDAAPGGAHETAAYEEVTDPDAGDRIAAGADGAPQAAAGAVPVDSSTTHEMPGTMSEPAEEGATVRAEEAVDVSPEQPAASILERPAELDTPPGHDHADGMVDAAVEPTEVDAQGPGRNEAEHAPGTGATDEAGRPQTVGALEDTLSADGEGLVDASTLSAAEQDAEALVGAADIADDNVDLLRPSTDRRLEADPRMPWIPEGVAGALDTAHANELRSGTALGKETRTESEPLPEAEPGPTGPSLTSRDPAERRTALAALAEREATAAELDTVAALILDPDPEIRRLAVETLGRSPAHLDDAVVRQALQDPADEVRAAAVRAAATRGIRDLPTLAPLVDARGSPETHRTVLELLPKILGEERLTAEALNPLLLAVAQLQPPPDETERLALSEMAASIATTLLIDGLTLPDARRLGAVRLLAGDRSHAVLHALAERAGDPLEEVRQAGLAAADEIARIEADAAGAAGPTDIAALAEDLRNPDPEHVERTLTALAAVDRPDVVAWSRERLAQGDAESVATVASLAAVLDLNEIGVELLTRGASLPPERRRPVVEALADFPDPSQLAGFLAAVQPARRADAVRLVWEASGRRILPELRSLLADPADEVRVAVIDIARDADDPASIEAVAGLLAADASPQVRAAAVRTIANSEGELPNVIRALGDPDPQVRVTAVESMPSAPAIEVGPVLAQALNDLDERVRIAAIERLAGVSSSEPALAWSALRRCRLQERDELLEAFRRTNPSLALEIALEHLYSPDEEERRLAVEITGWGASQAAVEAAIRALGDPIAEVRRAAVGALARLRDRSAVAALGNTLADPDADVRIGAVRALGVIDDEGVLAFLVAALRDPDQRVRETTSHVLTEWSSPAVAKRLAGVLAVPSLRESAADLLRRIGPTSVELLIDVLIQGAAEIRRTVGPLLEQIIGIDEFLGRLDSLEPERRLRALEALGAIAGPLAVDALMRSLSDPDERIRLRATQLLGELGDPIAADAVRRLVDDPVPDVAAAARSALETDLDGRGEDA